MTKEDYMKLSKERLAELLEERDNELKHVPFYPPLIVPATNIPCYAPNGICINPQHDCVNCPKIGGGGYTWTVNTITTEKSDMKYHNEDIAACTNDKCKLKDTCLRWQIGKNDDTYQTYLDGNVCEGEFYVKSKEK